MRKTVHSLKSWPRFFEAIVRGERVHELRRNDRGFAVGDLCELREYDPANNRFSGHVITVEVTSITSAEVPCAVSSEALHPDFCILSIKLRPDIGASFTEIE